MDDEAEQNEFEDILQEEGLQILSGLKDVELDPTGLDTLFNCDQPLKLTREQRAVVIEGLRRARAKYLKNKKQKSVKRKAKADPAEIEGLSLEDLDLDLSDLI